MFHCFFLCAALVSDVRVLDKVIWCVVVRWFCCCLTAIHVMVLDKVYSLLSEKTVTNRFEQKGNFARNVSFFSKAADSFSFSFELLLVRH